MKSWKTSTGGIATIVAGLAAAVTLWCQENKTEAVSTAMAAIATGFGLLSARDNKVTSQDAGAVNKPPEPPPPK
jgi:hypothetical protein